MSSTPAIMSFSGGKDSVFALYQLQQKSEYSVQSLIATLSREFNRVCMHGVRRELIQQQAAAIGLPLELVELSSSPDNTEYVQRTSEAFNAWKQRGVTDVIFGDLFLADLRRWREEQLASIGMRGIFPIWGLDTPRMAHDFIAAGFKAVLVCVDLEKLVPEFAGRDFDESLLADLPPGIDPCGENGEFHTFVHDGPLFASPVKIVRGDAVTRGRFRFQDLLAAAKQKVTA